MYYLINKYFRDIDKFKVKVNGVLKPLSQLTLGQFFNFVKNIPYKKDIKPIEIISRPEYLIKNRKKGLDCKKKAILICSYLKNYRLPFRLASSSKLISGRIHHVFPQMQLQGNWQNLDATYNYYKPFEKKTVTNFEVL